MTKLFYYLLFPLRLWRKYEIRKELNVRLKNAIKKAKIMAFEKKAIIYVCQNAHEFFIGTSTQMQNTQKAFKKLKVQWTWYKHIKFQTK